MTLPGLINRRLIWQCSKRAFILAAFIVFLTTALAGFGQTEPQAPQTEKLPSSGPQLSFTVMRKQISSASQPAPAWDGPRAGPAGVEGKSIAIISEDLRNGGILGVAQGIQNAAGAMKWNVKIFDAGGTPSGRAKAASDALASAPDGLMLVGADADVMRPQLLPFSKRGIPIVGWHVGSKVGATPDSLVAMNVSTDPLQVARITAMAAVVASQGEAGVVIFTDSNFEIAMAKANAMAEVIRASKGCKLLEIRDIAISKAWQQVPAAVNDLFARYGQQWTHALAINDIYFDYAVPELSKASHSQSKLSLLSAGDGSSAAFLRIKAGLFQTATVAEPLNLHGWQMVDELNRLLAHQPVSGYIAPVHLVTTDNVAFDGGPQLKFDPENGYPEIYRSIWKR